MSYELRVTGPDEWRAASDTFGLALHYGPVSDEDWPSRHDTWEQSHSISAWDEGRCVGHGSFFFLATSVPGGEMLSTAGVTRVGVQATHTRRGILTSIMRRMLHDANDQQRPLASLRASEATIYQRFGFGMSGEAMDVEIRDGRMRPDVGVAGSYRFVERDEFLDVVPPLYDRIAYTRPGVVRRAEWMWKRYFDTFLDRSKARQVVLHLDPDGTPDGYVDIESEFPDGANAEASAQVLDLWGADADAEAALWRYVFGLDLVRVVKAEERPIDDLVKWFLVDRRALKVKSLWDEQWVRLVDVDAALRARSWSSDEAVTLDVTDGILGHNDGRWRIADGKIDRADTGGAADLVVDVAALGAAYMGATSWTEIATTPMLREPADPATLARADRLFNQRPLPRCGSFF